MPGIAGIISQRPAAESEALVRTMANAMTHEAFYRSGVVAEPGLGVCCGWVGLENSGGPAQVSQTGDGNQTLILSGDCFATGADGSGEQRGQRLLALYAAHGEKFVEQLNGLFSGLLIDRSRRQILLFNDRYGFDRIYLHETADGLYFASEAGALLRALPHLREFDPAGVHQFLAVGCTLETQTFFRGVSQLPGGSVWTFAGGKTVKHRYFSPATWEAQPVLSSEAFQERFNEILGRIGPRYYQADAPLAIAMTAGLDSRMLLATRPASTKAVAYTFGGRTGDTLDARQAAKLARACGMEHHTVRVTPEFLREYPAHLEKTIRVTGGYFGALGAHEIYLNRQARALAPVRLTGVFGGEVLREVCTFKRSGLAGDLLGAETAAAVEQSARAFTAQRGHPVTFAAFREIPWNIHGSVTACRSQVTFRTPYMDNELVALAYQAPPAVRNSSQSALKFIRAQAPVLATIPTDMGFLGDASKLVVSLRYLFAKVTFKMDYLANEGLPSAASFLDPLLDQANARIGIPGLHKFLWYRRWFRRELSGFLQERLSDLALLNMPFWNPAYVRNLAALHISGRRNCVREIDAVLTLDGIRRHLLHP